LTDPGTGIVFDTWPVPSSATAGGLTFGVALPSNALTVDATEFIGYLVGLSNPVCEIR
jgi:cellobiose dehydrogenase (acceptor)